MTGGVSLFLRFFLLEVRGDGGRGFPTTRQFDE